MPQLQPSVSAIGTTISGAPSRQYLYAAEGSASGTAAVSSINTFSGAVSFAPVVPTTVSTVGNTITLGNGGVLSLTGGTGMTASNVAGVVTVNKTAGLTFLPPTNVGVYTGAQAGSSATFVGGGLVLPAGTYQYNFYITIPFSCLTFSATTGVYVYGSLNAFLVSRTNEPLAVMSITGGAQAYDAFHAVISDVVVVPPGSSQTLTSLLEFTNATFVNNTGSTALLSYIKLS